MLCDHLGKIFFRDLVGLQYVGRLAFPIFAFGVAQGYLHTKNFGNYLKRMVVFALVSQVPYTMFQVAKGTTDLVRFNVIFTLLMGLLAMYAYDKIKAKWIAIVLVLGICLVAELTRVDYGAYGVGLVMLFYFYARGMKRAGKDMQQKVMWTLVVGLCFAVMTILRYMDGLMMGTQWLEFWVMTIVWTVVSFVLIVMYNGKLGPKCKYLFYVFYPVHLFVISLIYFGLGG